MMYPRLSALQTAFFLSPRVIAKVCQSEGPLAFILSVGLFSPNERRIRRHCQTMDVGAPSRDIHCAFISPMSCKMLVWLTLGCEIGASLILACVNTVVALALIALSLSLAIAVSLLANCAPLQARARPSSTLGAEVYE
jgi:hypothetical protein